MTICTVREHCKLRHCEDENKRMFINPDNCTCRECMEKFPSNRQCPVSGDCCNTANECEVN